MSCFRIRTQTGTGLVQLSLIGLAGMLLSASGPVSRLEARAIPDPPKNFSILESVTVGSEPAAPPTASLPAQPEPPPPNLRESNPPEEIPDGDPRFADLFLEFAQEDTVAEELLAPAELAPLTPEQVVSETGLAPSEVELGSQLKSESTGQEPLFPTLPTADGYAVLLAGPVHEALIAGRSLPGAAIRAVVAPQAPPAAVNETPAGDVGQGAAAAVPRFSGQQVQWISGYWAWLSDAQTYVWISGLYRDVPPGRTWIPGQWQATADGFRWYQGYWAEAAADGTVAARERIQIASPPPAPLEQSATTEAPSANSFWIAGAWVPNANAHVAAARRDASQAENSSAENAPAGKSAAAIADAPTSADVLYRWQPGFWATHAPLWIWQPAHYAESPEGYRWVSGYWDYEPHYRGQAYAAVIFSEPAVVAQTLSFTPRYPMSRPIATLLHLFTKPASGHYYYGDLYSQRHQQVGFEPWYLAEDANSCPLLGFYQWKFAQRGLDFVASMNRFAEHFRSAPGIRPAAQIARDSGLALREGLAGQVNAASFDEIVRGSVGSRPALTLSTTATAEVITAPGIAKQR